MLSRTVRTGLLIAMASALAVQVGLAQQTSPVLVRAAIAGEVLAFHLVHVGQMVSQGDPLLYVRCETTSAQVLAAVAPVNGRVARVIVRPGSRVRIGDVVAAIQPATTSGLGKEGTAVRQQISVDASSTSAAPNGCSSAR